MWVERAISYERNARRPRNFFHGPVRARLPASRSRDRFQVQRIVASSSSRVSPGKPPTECKLPRSTRFGDFRATFRLCPRTVSRNARNPRVPPRYFTNQARGDREESNVSTVSRVFRSSARHAFFDFRKLVTTSFETRRENREKEQRERREFSTARTLETRRSG